MRATGAYRRRVHDAFVLCLLATLTLIPMQARADLFIGAKAGSMLVDIPTGDDPTNLAVALCVDLDVMRLDLGVTAESTRTLREGQTRNGGDIEVATDALYLTIKSPGTIFVKFRAGFIDERLTAGNRSDRERGTSVGSGLGANVGKVRIELEYTIGEDIEYLSLGVQFLASRF